MFRQTVFCLAVATFAAACSPREEILVGERLDIRGGQIGPSEALGQDVTVAFRAPPQVNNSDWTHRAGGPTHLIPHAAFSTSPSLRWTANIGQGNGRKHRMTGDPVVANGRIFAMDSRAKVTAVSADGSTLWSRDLTPASDREDDASGGGIAVSGNTLLVTTGFGRLHALDATSGAEIWEQRLNAGASSPTVRDGIAYVMTRDSRAIAIDVETGRELWVTDGLETEVGFDGGAGAAVDERLAILPLASGELVGAFRQGGLRLWSVNLLGERVGEVFARIREISGDPVIAGDRVYVGTIGGRTLALDSQTGERIWTADDGALSPVMVAGGSVFLMSDKNALIRLDAATGTRIWATELPFFVKQRERRQRDVFAFFGPILAGGQLWVAASDGALLAFDAETGAERGRIDLPKGAASNPVVTGGTMYVLNGAGQLLAFR